MSFPTRSVAVAGILSALAGIVFVVYPGIAVGLTTSDIIVSVLGVIALVQGITVVIAQQRSPRRWTEMPAPEYRTGARPPGASFDSALERLDPAARDRLTAAAVAVLTRFDDVTEDEAREQLDRGIWTDDRRAAAFFSSEVSPRRERRPTWFRGQPGVVDQARAAVSALAGIAGERSVRSIPPDDGHRSSTGDGEPITGAMRGDSVDAPSITTADRAANSPVDVPSAGSVAERRTGRWHGIGALTLIAMAIGVLVAEPPLVLVGAVGVAATGYAAYGRAGTATPHDLAVERVVAAGYTTPGDEVPVVVTVKNESDSPVLDIRIVDGVPPGLVVVDGTPRHAASLRPGETTTFHYTVRAEHGEHGFEPATIAVRDPTGERERVVRVEGESEPITCRISPETADDLTLRSHASDYAGTVQTDERGRGIEFYSTREYRPSDPLASIDWKRLARTRELATVEFREEQMAKIVLIVDDRAEAHRARDWNGRSAVAASGEAADVLVHTLLDANNRVGTAALSSERCWLAPGSGREHRIHARQVLANHLGVASRGAEKRQEESFIVSVQSARLRRRIPDDAQAIILSPLCDDDAVELIRRLEAGGTPTTVVSPDPTTAETPGRQLARIERIVRIASLRQAGIPIYEWSIDEPLERAMPTALARAET